ncbi:MAG: hypothetical protein D6722_18810 [Bacteroidetes bacterium]|nr:MAG: hypothetical protein D6722_18810 [Bacteroidota bacterium]
MASTRLETLSARFWQGQASPAEEEELRMAAASGLLDDPELSAYLHFLAQTRQEGLGQTFDQKMMTQVKASAPRPSSSEGPSRAWLWAGGMAATFALLLSIALVSWQADPPPPVPAPPVVASTPTVEAYGEVKKALFILSRNLHRGFESQADQRPQ